jgi:probable rRNA maturation factor
MSNNRTIDVIVSDTRLHLEAELLRETITRIEEVLPHPLPIGSLVIDFVPPDTCSALHNQFFGDPEITDVMTFPGDPEDEHAGDIAICPEVAANASAIHQQSFSAELTLYLVHACLHLAGLDDQSDAASAQMRQAEWICMDHLMQQGALLKGSWQI